MGQPGGRIAEKYTTNPEPGQSKCGMRMVPVRNPHAAQKGRTTDVDADELQTLARGLLLQWVDPSEDDCNVTRHQPTASTAWMALAITALASPTRADAEATPTALSPPQLERQAEPMLEWGVPITVRATRDMHADYMLQGEQHLAAPDQDLALYTRVLLTNTSYADHIQKDGGLGVVAALDATVNRHITAGLALRATTFEESDEDGDGTEGGLEGTEIWTRAGWTEPAWGVTLVLAVLTDSEDDSELDTQVLGVRYRYSELLGDVNVDASWSLYAADDVLRLAPYWRVPLTQRLWIQPGFAVQWAGEGYGNFSLAAGLTLARVEVTGQLHWGGQVRPVYLDTMTAFNVSEVVTHGADLGIAVPIGEPWTLLANYQWQHLRTDATAVDDVITDSLTSDAHQLTVGVGFSY
jgi:hypothetical protein